MHLGEVQEALADLDGVRTVAVMLGTVELLAAVRAHLGLTIPLLSDPDWSLHHRYGMIRGSRRAIFLSIATWKAYARLLRQWNFTRPTEDVLQLGGAVVVDSVGTVAWIHRGENPADYADPHEIVDAVRAIAKEPEANGHGLTSTSTERN